MEEYSAGQTAEKGRRRLKAVLAGQQEKCIQEPAL